MGESGRRLIASEAEAVSTLGMHDGLGMASIEHDGEALTVLPRPGAGLLHAPESREGVQARRAGSQAPSGTVRRTVPEDQRRA